MQLLTHDQYSYKFDPCACEACGGHCCTGESGYIWAKYDEIEKMADFVNLSVEDFATMYLRKVKHRYSLIEKSLHQTIMPVCFLMRRKNVVVFTLCDPYSVVPFHFGNSLKMMKKR